MVGQSMMVVSVQNEGEAIIPGRPEQLFSGPFDAQQTMNFL